MKYLILSLFLIIFVGCRIKKESDSTSMLVECDQKLIYISEFWKKDSLANNGYRFEQIVNQQFSNCSGNFLKSDILNYLGKPDEVDSIESQGYMKCNS